MAIDFKKLVMKGIQNPAGFFKFIINLPKFVKLYYRLYNDRRVPFYLKLILLGAIIYVISPLDIIADYAIPVIGQVDDLIVLIAALRYFLRKCPIDVLNEHVDRIQLGL